MNPSPKPQPRPLQFSLRIMFVAILIIAPFFAGQTSVQPIVHAERARADMAAKETRDMEAYYRRLGHQAAMYELLMRRKEVQDAIRDRDVMRTKEVQDAVAVAKKRLDFERRFPLREIFRKEGWLDEVKPGNATE